MLILETELVQNEMCITEINLCIVLHVIFVAFFTVTVIVSFRCTINPSVCCIKLGELTVMYLTKCS